jgi:hypothetical protein
MKLIKTADKRILKLTKSDWQAIGKKAGWINLSYMLAINPEKLPAILQYNTEQAIKYGWKPISEWHQYTEYWGANFEKHYNDKLGNIQAELRVSKIRGNCLGFGPSSVPNPDIVPNPPDGDTTNTKYIRIEHAAPAWPNHPDVLPPYSGEYRVISDDEVLEQMHRQKTKDVEDNFSFRSPEVRELDQIRKERQINPPSWYR